ncbi:MAG: hypothetical protein QOG73_1398 [Acetobacteraceae bacterium]|nr:hypothetical protein [Acetobacteraceae bacterium]
MLTVMEPGHFVIGASGILGGKVVAYVSYAHGADACAPLPDPSGHVIKGNAAITRRICFEQPAIENASPMIKPAQVVPLIVHRVVISVTGNHCPTCRHVGIKNVPLHLSGVCRPIAVPPNAPLRIEVAPLTLDRIPTIYDQPFVIFIIYQSDKIRVGHW